MFSCTPRMNPVTDVPNEFRSKALGTTRSDTPAITTRVAASPCLPPILRASALCSGWRVTAMMMAQTISVRNGAKTT